MENVISRRSFKFYFNLVVPTLFCFSLGIFTLRQFIDEIRNDSFQNKHILLLLCSFATVAFAVHNIYIHLTKVPSIYINLKYITFNKKVYNITKIKSITFTGKKAFGDVYPRKESAQIILDDGKSFIIYDDYYNNSAELKLFLESVYLNKNLKVIPDTTNSNLENFHWIRGGIIGMHSLMLICILGLFLLVTVNVWDFKALLVPASFFILISIYFKRFFYFGISNNYLQVKSYTLPWVKQNYNLSNIKGVILNLEEKHLMAYE